MKRTLLLILAAVMILSLAGCAKERRIVPIASFSPTSTPKPEPTEEPTPEPIPQPPMNESGDTLNTRFNPAYGYNREQPVSSSFAAFLQSLPLKAYGSSVQLHSGEVRETQDYEAVVDLATLDKGELAAGMLARMHMEYLYSQQKYESMVYTLTDGFQFDFNQWRQGKGIRLSSAQKIQWTDNGTDSDGRANFEAFAIKYVDWSNVDTLIKDMEKVEASDPIRIGDIFINKTSTKNYQAVIVADSVTNAQGDQRVLLAGGDRPAQQIRVWRNPLDSQLSPWFTVDNTNGLINVGGDTTFTIESRYRFAED